MARIVKKWVYVVGIGLAVLSFVGLFWVWSVIGSLPDVSGLAKFQPKRVSEVYDQNGKSILQLPQNPSRLWVPLSEIAESLQMSVITMEDDTFFQHKGINYKETWNAFKEDIKKRKYKRGGSTITQQLAKNLFLSKEKTLSRKLKEYFLARKIEEILPKDKILERYLNEVEWGDGIYGAEMAARYYFDKRASELDLPESTFLAAMLANPHYYHPDKNPERLRNRRKLLISLLKTNHMINDDEYREIQQAHPNFRTRGASHDPNGKASLENPPLPCHLGILRDYLLATYGEAKLMEGDVRLNTTLDLQLQGMLEVSAAKADIPMNPDSPALFLAVKEGEATRGLICVETGEQGLKIVRGLEQPIPAAKDYIFSFEDLPTFRWELLFPKHTAA
jgi:membrane peptidoglycan carboxypeptidase